MGRVIRAMMWVWLLIVLSGFASVAFAGPNDPQLQWFKAATVSSTLAGNVITVRVMNCPCVAGTRNRAGMCNLPGDREDAALCTTPAPGATIYIMAGEPLYIDTHYINDSTIVPTTGTDGIARVDLARLPPPTRRIAPRGPGDAPVSVGVVAKTPDGATFYGSNTDVSGTAIYAQWVRAAEAQQTQLSAQQNTQAAQCSAGRGDACYAVGVRKCWGSSAPPVSLGGGVLPCFTSHDANGNDVPAGLPEFQKACQLHHQHACDILPKIQTFAARHEQRQQAESAQRQEQAAQQQQRDTDDLHARCLRRDNAACLVYQNISQCEQGLSTACDSAGNAYLSTLVGPRDVNKALIYWRKACDISPTACYAHGAQLYIGLLGLTGPTYQAMGLSFLDSACQGDASQCGSIGAFLRQKGNATKAREFFTRGCNAGAANACQMLQTR